MSFWKNNPFSPSWTNSVSSWWNSTPPRLLVSQTQYLPFSQGLEIQIVQANTTHVSALCEFWRRYFSITSSAICQIPAQIVLKGIEEKRWEIFMAIESSGEIVGTGVRKWIRRLTVDAAVFQKAAMIDYFCVHPAWRNRGIGRRILQVLHNSSFTHGQTLPPHLILWEGVSLGFPPISWGLFWAKRCRGFKKNIIHSPFTLCKREDLGAITSIWRGFQGRVKTEYEGNEVVCYRGAAGSLAIWNTFHKSPEGGWIGIVVGASGADAVNVFSEQRSPFSVLLASRSLASGEGWVADSPFQFILYNCSYSAPLYQEFPVLGI